jgi:hypothetical protein
MSMLGEREAPEALDAWVEAVEDARVARGDWMDDAVDWQIQAASAARLSGSEKKVVDALARVRTQHDLVINSLVR